MKRRKYPGKERREEEEKKLALFVLEEGGR